jgi:WD40 repeat protein
LIPNSTINVEKLFVEGEEDMKITTIKFDPLNRYIAAGNKYLSAARRDGKILIFNVKKQAVVSTISSQNRVLNHPFTYISWRPENENFKTKNILNNHKHIRSNTKLAFKFGKMPEYYIDWLLTILP